METSVFSHFRTLSNSEAEKTRQLVVDYVTKKLEDYKDDPLFTEHVAIDIVDLEDEMVRANRAVASGSDKNVAYPLVLSIGIDTMRRAIRTHNGEYLVGLSVFLGLRTDEEDEHRQSSRLSKVVQRENRVVIDEVRQAIKSAVAETASLTVETLRRSDKASKSKDKAEAQAA